jgi:glyoxylate/succinic semialdehyde reductase
MVATLPAVPAPVGFVGLGMMGGRLAARLARAGDPLVVTNRSIEKASPVVAAGARAVPKPRAVGEADGRGVVLTMLSDGLALERAVFGRSGLAGGLEAGSLVIDLSTVRPEETRAFAERLARTGIQFLDAPVGGSVDAAEAGSLIFYVGGDPIQLERARPLLVHLGHEIQHLGPVGQGSAMKLVNHHLTIGNIAPLAEALAFGERLGIERPKLLELLGRGGGRSAMLERKRSQLLDRKYDPQFRLALALKDLFLVERSGRAAETPTRLTREARRLLEEAVDQGHAEEDFSAVLEAAIARSGPRAPPTDAPSP